MQEDFFCLNVCLSLIYVFQKVNKDFRGKLIFFLGVDRVCIRISKIVEPDPNYFISDPYFVIMEKLCFPSSKTWKRKSKNSDVDIVRN